MGVAIAPLRLLAAMWALRRPAHLWVNFAHTPFEEKRSFNLRSNASPALVAAQAIRALGFCLDEGRLSLPGRDAAASIIMGRRLMRKSSLQPRWRLGGFIFAPRLLALVRERRR